MPPNRPLAARIPLGILAGIAAPGVGIGPEGKPLLTDTRIRNAKPKADGYRLTDGGGLALFVTPSGAKVWRLRFKLAGKEQTLVLGPYPAVTLADARRRRDEAQRRLALGEDPRTAAAVAKAPPTLAEVTARWHATNLPRWSEKHGQEVLTRLTAEILTPLGAKPIAEVTAPELLAELRRIERRSVEIAHRIRGTLATVFAFAIGEGSATVNPATMIADAMAPLPRGNHRPAVTTLPAAQEVLRRTESIPAHPVTRLALRFLALTAVRPGEVAGAEWQEIEGDVWRIPPARMKMAREHVVPLTPQAVEVLETVKMFSRRSAFTFPSGSSAWKSLSEAALNTMLRRAGLQGVHVPHGWRATFSTVMNERYPADRQVIDLMLAHAPKDQVEAAYNRAQHMERRRELAGLWAGMLLDGMPPAGALVDLRRK